MSLRACARVRCLRADAPSRARARSLRASGRRREISRAPARARRARLCARRSTCHAGRTQPAQPIRWSHRPASHAWAWRRDAQRLAQLAERADAAAGRARRGPPVRARPPPRARRPRAGRRPTVDAVSDRDFIAEFLFAGGLHGVHLSRFAEDLIIYGTREFGFVRFSDACV